MLSQIGGGRAKIFRRNHVGRELRATRSPRTHKGTVAQNNSRRHVETGGQKRRGQRGTLRRSTGEGQHALEFGHRFHGQRSLRVARLASAHPREITQKRRTTFVSGQPFF